MGGHTPGPWHIEPVNEDGEVLIVSAPGAEPGYPRESFTVAESTFQNSPRGLANARLIALAPRLLAFVESYAEPATDLVAKLKELDAEADAILKEVAP